MLKSIQKIIYQLVLIIDWCDSLEKSHFYFLHF